MPAQIIENLVWIDIEMTGLDVMKDKIMQIACVVTDKDLNLLDEVGLSVFVKIEKEDIKNMIPVVLKMHTESGVLEKSIGSDLTIEDADKILTEYIAKYTKKRTSPLCGTTISADRAFIDCYMPMLKDYLHYRNIDVATFNQVFNILGLPKLTTFTKSSHEALGDIKYSISELKYYFDVLKQNIPKAEVASE